MKSPLIVVISALTIASPASAGGLDPIRIRVGGGVLLKPDYIGSDKDKLGPLFRLDIARGTNPFRFKAPDDPIGLRLVSSGGFSAGPSLNFESKRRESDVGAPVGEVGATVEVGGFAQYEVANSLRFRVDVRKGIDGHKGVVGSLGIDKFWRDGDRYVFSIGPRLLFSDDRYQQAYFGVTPQVALATGLPVYIPRGGLYGVAAATGLTYQFNDRIGMFGYGRYERLVGDAARSPIVLNYGSRDQWSGGIGLSYTFTVRP